MSTTIKTHTVIKTSKSNVADKSALEARAARFKTLANTTPSGTASLPSTKPFATAASKTTDPEMAEKLARRAARFADVNSAPVISTTGKVCINSGTSSNMNTAVTDAEKLAKRTARFADVGKKA